MKNSKYEAARLKIEAMQNMPAERRVGVSLDLPSVGFVSPEQAENVLRDLQAPSPMQKKDEISATLQQLGLRQSDCDQLFKDYPNLRDLEKVVNDLDSNNPKIESEARRALGIDTAPAPSNAKKTKKSLDADEHDPSDGMEDDPDHKLENGSGYERDTDELIELGGVAVVLDSDGGPTAVGPRRGNYGEMKMETVDATNAPAPTSGIKIDENLLPSTIRPQKPLFAPA